MLSLSWKSNKKAK